MLKLLARIKKLFLYWLTWGVVIFPCWLKIPIYRRLYGYKIGRNVKIGLSWINVGRLEIGDHVIIGHLVRFKDIPEVKIGDYCTFGFGTTFTSTTEFINPKAMTARGNQPILTIGNHCGIAMLHYFDIQDSFTAGDFTTIAGRGSVFFTHYLDVVTGTQSTKSISIGRYCMIGSNVLFTPGATVPDCCVVGMGAVVTQKFMETHCLIGGNPAVKVRQLPDDAAYFKRTVGWIGEFSRPPEGFKQAGDDYRPG